VSSDDQPPPEVGPFPGAAQRPPDAAGEGEVEDQGRARRHPLGPARATSSASCPRRSTSTTTPTLRARGPRTRPEWNASWSQPQHTGGHRRHRTRTESPGRTPEGVGDHDLHRSPEAGAQVRILPGAPPVTCDNYFPQPQHLSDSPVSWTQMARLESTIGSMSIFRRTPRRHRRCQLARFRS
jgi:hypothetical protein